MGYVKICNACAGRVTEGAATETGFFIMESCVVGEQFEGVSPSIAPAGLPDLVASCHGAANLTSNNNSTQCAPVVSPEDVKLIGRRLRYISDSFDWRTSVTRRNEPVVIHDWFTDFLTACVSSVMEWWKTTT
ncbi:uncharacterized protein LOC119373711 [Rhipicephalus sanguineus]|uniref:uncharacterized protein LOC119373711 n=1 Tax=Rhipicephalus sanguineus TaxID=34632 RepID=UPI001895A46A|nr:uncharacterized protein LOC119373711 [Rhipicephalus sanguineus]